MFLQKHNSITLTLALVIVLCLGNSAQFLRAQPAAPSYGSQAPPTIEEGQEIAVCMEDMKLFLADESPKYQKWLDSHFNNKSSSTSLLSDAFARYADYRKSLYTRYARYFPQQGALQLSEGLELQKCLQMVEDALKNARESLEQKAITSSNVKKTTVLISKYQEINGELRNLYQSFITMKKNLDTFSDKLLCYVAKSCNKG